MWVYMNMHNNVVSDDYNCLTSFLKCYGCLVFHEFHFKNYLSYPNNHINIINLVNVFKNGLQHIFVIGIKY